MRAKTRTQKKTGEVQDWMHFFFSRYGCTLPQERRAKCPRILTVDTNKKHLRTLQTPRAVWGHWGQVQGCRLEAYDLSCNPHSRGLDLDCCIHLRTINRSLTQISSGFTWYSNKITANTTHTLITKSLGPLQRIAMKIYTKRRHEVIDTALF